MNNHGESKTRLYKIWKSMRYRCSNPNASEFKHYGGRGIAVCAEWNKNYESFRDWALLNGYRDDLTIDRIDVNSGYRPDNCRWATKLVQANNMRTNHIIEFNGQTNTIAEWARIIGIDHHSLLSRLKRGWSLERALTEQRNCSSNPVRIANSKPVVCIETGQTFQSASMASAFLGLKRSAVSAVLNGYNKTAGGYHWKYLNSEDKNNKKLTEHKRRSHQ